MELSPAGEEEVRVREAIQMKREKDVTVSGCRVLPHLSGVNVCSQCIDPGRFYSVLTHKN